MTTLFVGNLPEDVRSRELEDMFYKFGKIESVNVRSKGKDTFAFVSFVHESDAHEAMKRRDGYQFDRHHRMRVEVSKGNKKDDRDRDYDRRDRGDRDYERRDRSDRDYDRRDRREYGSDKYGSKYDKYDSGRSNRREKPVPKIHEKYFKVVADNIPEGCSWQDLKDFIKKDHPSVKFTEIRDGKGIAGFETREEAEKVIEGLNNATLRTRDGAEAAVTLSLSAPEVSTEEASYNEAPAHNDSNGNHHEEERNRSRSRSRE